MVVNHRREITDKVPDQHIWPDSLRAMKQLICALWRNVASKLMQNIYLKRMRKPRQRGVMHFTLGAISQRTPLKETTHFPFDVSGKRLMISSVCHLNFSQMRCFSFFAFVFSTNCSVDRIVQVSCIVEKENLWNWNFVQIVLG